MCERDERPVADLVRAADASFAAALAFYRARRGTGAKAIDVSKFFARRSLHTQFQRFWGSRANVNKRKFDRAWVRFNDGLRDWSEAD